MFENPSWQGDTFISPTNPKFSVFSGAFGGWTVAHAMTAALNHKTEEQTPLALTIDFCKGIGEGVIESTPSIVSATKSTSFVQVKTTQNGALAAQTSVVFSRRRDTDHIPLLAAPTAPAPESIKRSDFAHPVATWIGSYEFRFIEGDVLNRNANMRSLAWMRMRPAQAWTWATLAGLADANFPRIYFHYPELSPIATVTMSVHFHLTNDELATLSADDYLLVDASAALAHAGIFDQTVRVWTRDGRLVLSSTQIAVFSVKSA
jgi:acyl-CoA thioesterase